MKTTINLLILTFLLLGASSQCFALIPIEDVSKERAKELGVTFRTNTDGQAGIRVWMEYKPKGELQKVTYVELQIGEGEEQIASASLQVSNPNFESASVNFSTFRKFLPKSTLMIVVYMGPKGDVGYRFKVKDFIELEKR